MKKNLSIFLVISLMLSFLSLPVQAKENPPKTSFPITTISSADGEKQKQLDYDESGDTSFLIKYKSKDMKEKGKEIIKKKGGTIEKEFKQMDVIKVKIKKELLKELKNNADIEYMEPDYKIKVNSDEIPWGIENVGATVAHKNEIVGEGIKLAVFDTGISKHPDLQLAGGASFVDGVDSYSDDNGHGTHVSGIISALINGQGIVGAAPSSDLYAIKVINKDGTGNYSSIIEGLEWAIDNKINIINMSFGGGSYSQILEEAINRAYENNILIFAAAGNEGESSYDTISYPAKYKNVISVGAVDKEDNRASFSSIGPDLELMAPGVNIKSTLNNSTYGMMSGTSMACPHTVGVAALLWSKNLSDTNITIRGLLDYSATGLGDKTQYGYGIVNINNALEMYDSYIASKNNSTGSQEKAPKKIKVKKNKIGDDLVNTNGAFQSYYVDSPHPYVNNYTNSWTTTVQGASSIRVHYEYIDTETNYDFVTTSTGNSWSGAYTSEWSNWSSSSSITTTLTTDSSVTGNGFRIDMLEYVPAAPTDDYGNSIGSAVNISPGTSIAGNIDYAGDEDFFRFVPSITGTYTIGTTGSTDTYGYLLDASGNQITYNDDSNGTANFSISYALNAGQTYYIRVKHYSNGTGAYNLFMNAPVPTDDYGNSIGSAANISPGTSKVGNIDYAGDEDFFRFVASITGTYTMGTTGSTDTYGYLLDASGNQIAYNDDSNGTTNFSISYSLNAGQTYYIRLKHYSTGTGAYTLFVSDPVPTDDYGNSISSATNISLGNSIAGTINYAGDEDFFRFVASITGTYTIGTTGSTDTYGYLLDASGNQIIYNDDSNGTANFSISYPLNAGQTYYIRIRHYSADTGTGAYNLLITAPIAQPDLTVSNIFWSPTNPIEGSNVSLSATIANQGIVATQNGVVHRVGFKVDGGATVIWSNNYTSSIAPGSEITVTANAGTNGQTWSAIAGNHTITAIVDDLNGITEENENNNSFQRSISVASNNNPAIENVYPLSWPTSSYQITQQFGSIDDLDLNTHTGIDIQGAEGEDIFSAVNGQVVYSGNQLGYGNVVFINSLYEGVNIQTRYAHLKEISQQITVGSTITAGTIIGKMGHTGNAVGNHLHFEVLEDSVNKDPLFYLQSMETDNNDYMSNQFSIGKTPGDTFAFDETIGMASINTSDIAILTPYQDLRYNLNLDLSSGQAYLNKLVEKYAFERDGTTKGQIASREILTWNISKTIATVWLNGKTKAYSTTATTGVNAVIKNARFVVNTTEFYNFFIKDFKWTPTSKIAKVVSVAGFYYNRNQDIICSTYNPFFQRKGGYCRKYDELAPTLLSSIIDCEPVIFNYGGKEWMIEFWKGQYGLETGAEIGVYNRYASTPNLPYLGRVYKCVSDSEILKMSFSLKNKNGVEIFHMNSEKHWWLTGFEWGVFTQNPSEDLIMDISITFKDVAMRDEFIGDQSKGMKGLGYTTADLNIIGNTVNFTFGRPKTTQTDSRIINSDSVQARNSSYVADYQAVKNYLHLSSNDPNEIEESLIQQAPLAIRNAYNRIIDYLKSVTSIF